MSRQVLVVDDNPGVREGLAKALRVEGFQVVTAENGVAGFAQAEAQSFDAILVDVMMPVLDGMRLYEALALARPQETKKIVFMSAWFDDPEVQRFLDRTGQPVIAKPFEIEGMVRLLRAFATPD